MVTRWFRTSQFFTLQNEKMTVYLYLIMILYDAGAVNASATVTEESETTTESMIADTTELSESGG